MSLLRTPIWAYTERHWNQKSRGLVCLILTQGRCREIPMGRTGGVASCPLNSHASFLDFLGGAIHWGCPGSADL